MILRHVSSTSPPHEILWTVRLRAVIPPCRIQGLCSITDPIRRYTEYMKPYLAKRDRRDVADHGEAAGVELYCSSGTGTVRKA